MRQVNSIVDKNEWSRHYGIVYETGFGKGML
jgi:hypothetical protein